MKICAMCETLVEQVVESGNYYLCADKKGCAKRLVDLVFGKEMVK